MSKNHLFAKTGSGQTQGKLKKRDRFLAVYRLQLPSPGCVWRHCLRNLYLKCIILPRQARDKHRESTQKRERMRFSQVRMALRLPTHRSGSRGVAAPLRTSRRARLCWATLRIGIATAAPAPSKVRTIMDVYYNYIYAIRMII
jgi:hypothetical protein